MNRMYNKYNYIPLDKPTLVTEQVWPKDTIPLVSVSTLTYNHEPFIRDAIESFLMQKTTFPIRIVIFDDVSTDGTREIVKEYETKYPNLIKGIYPDVNTYGKRDLRREAMKPRNEVRNIAKYIALCEGDDYWTDPLKLQKQVDFLEENEEYAMCFHNAIQIFENDPTLNKPFRNIETREYTGAEILAQWTIPTASVVFKKDMYMPVSHPDFMYGDIILFLSLAEKGKIWGMEEIMSIYRTHDGGVVAMQKHDRVSYYKRFIKHHEAIQSNFGGKYEKVEDELLAKSYLGLAIEELRSYQPSFLLSATKGYKKNSKVFRNNLLLRFRNLFNLV